MRLTRTTTNFLLGSNNGILSKVLERSVQCRSFATPAPQSSENKHSFISTQKVPTIDNTIGYVLSKNARATPFSNAFRAPQQNTTYSHSVLKRHAEALACGFLELGLRVGDRVGVILNATSENFLVQLACAKTGSIVVQFSGVNNAKDLTRYLDLFRPRFLVLPPKVGKLDYFKMVQDTLPELDGLSNKDRLVPVRTKRFPFLKQVLFTGHGIGADRPPVGAVLQSCLLYGPFGYYENPLRRVALKINADAPSIIVVDGGAPDKGKNVVWTQRNILNSANTLVSSLNLTNGDVVFVPGYNQTSFGIVANYAAFLAGAAVVYPSREFNADEVLRLLEDEKCTVLFVRKSHVDELLAPQSDVVAEKLKYIVTDQLTNEDVNNLKKRFPKAQIKQLGGLDEAAGLLSIDGDLVSGVEVKVTRDKDDRIVHKDTYGDLRVRGATISKKLWNDIGLMNADVDEEGWVRTGRMGKVDNNGRLVIQ